MSEYCKNICAKNNKLGKLSEKDFIRAYRLKIGRNSRRRIRE